MLAGENEENELTLTLAEVNIKCYHHPRGSSSTAAYKVGYAHLPYSPSIEHLSQRNENLHSPKNLYANIHNSFICNSQKLETIQMSFSRQMANELRNIHTMEYYSSNEKGTSCCYIHWLEWIARKSCWVKESQSQSRKVTHCTFHSRNIFFEVEKKNRNGGHNIGFQGLEKKGAESRGVRRYGSDYKKGNMRDLCGAGTAEWLAVLVDTWIYPGELT